MVNQIKNLLGVELSETTNNEVVLAQLQLENGTILEAESFESGKEIFILTEDQKVALPVGEYMLEDGRILNIQEEGLISEIKAEKEEEDEKEEDEKKDKEEEKMEYVTKEEFRKEMDDLKKVIEEMGYGKKEEDKEEMSQQVSLAVTEILNEQEQLKEELSQPAAKPLKHSPENKDEKKLSFKFNKGPLTTQDHVNQMIYNINKK